MSGLTTGDVRHIVSARMIAGTVKASEAEFDAWLAEHDAQVLREAADEVSAAIGTEPLLMHVVDWTEGVEYAERTIRARADAMTRQADAPGEAELVCTPGTRCTPWPHPHAHTAPAADDEGGRDRHATHPHLTDGTCIDGYDEGGQAK